MPFMHARIADESCVTSICHSYNLTMQRVIRAIICIYKNNTRFIKFPYTDLTLMTLKGGKHAHLIYLGIGS